MEARTIGEYEAGQIRSLARGRSGIAGLPACHLRHEQITRDRQAQASISVPGAWFCPMWGDNTPACEAQFCSYRDRPGEFAALGTTVVGISAQDVSSHQGFIGKNSLTVPLLADVDGAVAKAYSAVGRLGTKRAVVVIDEEGIVRHRHDHLLGLDYRSVDDLKAALDALPSPAAQLGTGLGGRSQGCRDVRMAQRAGRNQIDGLLGVISTYPAVWVGVSGRVTRPNHGEVDFAVPRAHRRSRQS
jgi:thioredoxin-dependent peroxiredoxin